MPPLRHAILPLSLATVLGGCIYTEGRTVRELGPQLSKESLAPIEPGMTSTEWLVALAGEPKACTRLSDGCELLRYDCDRRTTEGSYLFMLFAASSNTIERTCWWFETKDGRIMRYWGEHCDPVTISPLDAEVREPVPPSAAATTGAATPTDAP